MSALPSPAEKYRAAFAAGCFHGTENERRRIGLAYDEMKAQTIALERSIALYEDMMRKIKIVRNIEWATVGTMLIISFIQLLP